jgi:hypothetical protein
VRRGEASAADVRLDKRKKRKKRYGIQKKLYLCNIKIDSINNLKTIYIMKKVLLALAVIETVACFSSCKKTCSCTTYAAGAVVSTTEVDLSKYEGVKKCSDLPLNNYITAAQTGIKCE